MFQRFLLIILFCKLFLPAEHISVKNFHIRNWNQNSGLPMNSALAITQSKEGYIWIATERGIARFDGISFTVFNTDSHHELESDYIISLFVDDRNRLWFGIRNAGVYFLENNRIKKLFLPPEMEIHSCWSIIQTTDRSLLFAGPGFIVSFQNGRLSRINLPVQSEIRFLYEDSKGYLWAGTSTNGLFRLFAQNNSFSVDLHWLEKSRINSISEDANGRFWIATEGNGLFFKDSLSEKISPFARDQIPDRAVRQLFTDQNGNIWVGTSSEGIFLINGQSLQITNFDPEHLLGYSIDRIFCDREKNLWIGSVGYGIYRLRRVSIQTITSQDGLSNDIVFPVLFDTRQRLWIGAASGGLNMLSDGKLRIFSRQDGLGENVVISLAEDNQGNIYAGTQTSGLYKLQKERFVKVSLPANVDSSIRALYRDKENRIWIGTTAGYLLKLEEHSVRPIAFLKRRINCLQKDENNNLWIATMDGLYILSPQNKLLDARRQFSIAEKTFISLYRDTKNTFWIGALRTGLLAIRNGKLYTISKKQHLPDDVIYAIAEDSQGNLFFSCNRGIIYFRRSEIEDFFRHEKNEINFSLIGSGHGLLSEEFNGGFQPAVSIARNRIFFPSTRGLVIIEPQKLEFNKSPPEIFIDRILVNGKEVPASFRIKVEEKSTLEIFFNSISFIQPEKMLFSWKMHNIDFKWSVPTNKRSVCYYNLPEGLLLFQVRAANNDGVWNLNGITLAINVYSRIWEKPLFIIAFYTLFLSLISSGIIIFRRKLVRKRRETQRDLLKHYSADEIERLKNKLIYLLEEEKIYRSSGLSLNSLARKLLISPRYLSQIINDKLKHNFNDLINHYRIQEAQKLLRAKDPKLTIIKIAEQVGFSSKSAFNRVFKEFTHQTPSEFIRQQQNQPNKNIQKSHNSRNGTS